MRTLGEYLVEDGALTTSQVDAVLRRQRELASQGEQKRFGEIVLDMRLVTSAQLQRALDRQQLERA